MTDTRTKTEGAPTFLHEEDGAVTVDWVVLAAAAVLLALPITALIAPVVDTSVDDIADQVVGATE